MKNRIFKKLKDNKGFSLIELMVAVAIIGILAAIAIPNYQAFQRRARQSEAKGMLSGIFTAQKSFIAEWGSGTTDLRVIGFYPDGDLGYMSGFGQAAAGNTTAVGCQVPTTAIGIGTPLRYNGQKIDAGQMDTSDVCVAAGVAKSGATTCENASIYGDLTTGWPAAWTPIPAYVVGNIKADCDTTDFIAGSIADLKGNVNDVWTIDHTKDLVNQQSGI